jgi:hypothetical protein
MTNVALTSLSRAQTSGRAWRSRLSLLTRDYANVWMSNTFVGHVHPFVRFYEKPHCPTFEARPHAKRAARRFAT